MKQDHDEGGLDSDAAAFLDSVRGLDEPTASDRHRVRRRVLAAVAATGAASAAGGTATAAAATTAGGASAGAGVIGSTLAAKVWIGVAIGVIGAGVAGGVATLAPETDEPAVVVSDVGERPSESVVGGRGSELGNRSSELGDRESESGSESASESASELQSESASESQSDGSQSSQSVPTRAPANRPARQPIESPSSPSSPPTEPLAEPIADPDTLAAELALIRRAHAAANVGNHLEALRILSEHASRFPNGTLAVEREGARAISLCGAGRAGEGQRVADRFLEAHPGSPLRGRVTRACAD